MSDTSDIPKGAIRVQYPASCDDCHIKDCTLSKNEEGDQFGPGGVCCLMQLYP